jgi:hypothetical protein
VLSFFSILLDTIFLSLEPSPLNLDFLNQLCIFFLISVLLVYILRVVLVLLSIAFINFYFGEFLISKRSLLFCDI